MPVEIIEAGDPITKLVRFQASAIYEMVVSLHTLHVARRHAEWVAVARQALGAEFLAELNAVYEPLGDGTILFEMPVDFPRDDDVLGFINYVRAMRPHEFIFYLIGRIIPRERLARGPLTLNWLLEQIEGYNHFELVQTALNVVMVDVSGFQARLCNLWQRYWDSFFRDQVPALRGSWAQAIAEKERMLTREQGSGLFRAVAGKSELPEPMPADYPIERISLVPIHFTSAQTYMFFGYGDVTLLFDSQRTEARVSEIDKAKEWSLGVAKALGDSTRLKILRLIAQYGGEIHGKKIAAYLDLSPSAVSRQLAQLRDCGLISEQSHDDQTITYRLNFQTITDLPTKLMEYLYS